MEGGGGEWKVVVVNGGMVVVNGRVVVVNGRWW